MENKKEMLSEAYKEGKIIQFNSSGEWKDFVPHNQVDFPNFDYKADNWRIKPKEETLEEAASKFSSDNYYATQSECFTAGANWQAKRMYTEEDLITFYNFLKDKCDMINTSGYAKTHVSWFVEQFKKKQS